MTTEKKEFLIPENVDEGVKILGDVKLKELIKTLAPSALLSAGLYFIPIDHPYAPFAKIGIAAMLFIVPGYMILERPVRRNIHILYMVKSYIRFMLREKHLPYRKEKYHAEPIENEQGREEEANSTKSDTNKGHTWWPINHK